jgi:hypothetical protein
MSVVSLARMAGFTALPWKTPSSLSSSRFDADTSMTSTTSCATMALIWSRNSGRVRYRLQLPSASRLGPVEGRLGPMSPSLASAMMKSLLA